MMNRKMKAILLGLSLAALAYPRPAAAQVGERAPKLVAVKWFNSPPLVLDELQEKAVWIQIFRTW